MSAAAFIIIAIFTLTGAVAAATMPRLIHAALSLVVAFIGIAAFYFLLGAEFVGLVQIFVYVGAVAVLIVFTILLTRREQENTSGFNWGGAVVAIQNQARDLIRFIGNQGLPGRPAPMK